MNNYQGEYHELHDPLYHNTKGIHKCIMKIFILAHKEGVNMDAHIFNTHSSTRSGNCIGIVAIVYKILWRAELCLMDVVYTGACMWLAAFMRNLYTNNDWTRIMFTKHYEQLLQSQLTYPLTLVDEKCVQVI